MNYDVIETAMQEIMEEQKENRKQVEQLNGKIDYLSALAESLKEQQNKGQTSGTSLSTSSMMEVQTELKDIKQLIRSQPKNIVHEKRFLFFPEHYAKEYYSIILRWILYIIIASYSYSILKHIIDHWSR